MFGEPASLSQQIVRPPGHEGTAECRNRAEGTATVASGGDLQRRHDTAAQTAPEHARTGRRCQARREVGYLAVSWLVGAASWPVGRGQWQQPAPVPRLMRIPATPGGDRVEPGGYVFIVIKAQDLRLGHSLGQARAVPLRQAAGGHDLRAAGRGAEQFVDGLLLRRLDEAAGVDQHYGGVLSLVGELPPAILQPGREFLGVHLVTGATEGHHPDYTPRGTWNFLTRRHTRRLR